MSTGATVRLTVGQAVVRFLARQRSERDGVEQPLFAGCFGIFGHGNVAGIGQALRQYADVLPYHMARNEQSMIHIASGYAKQRNRLATFACTSSIGPGATNMVTGAATATVSGEGPGSPMRSGMEPSLEVSRNSCSTSGNTLRKIDPVTASMSAIPSTERRTPRSR